MKLKLIFNPNAGAKRKLLPNVKTPYLEEIKNLLKQYQISVDFYPTRRLGHATVLARNATKENYKTVIIAGGDGTVGEAANGLVGGEVNLAVIPLGSFMNIARMLSIPLDIEKAIMLIKIGRSRKIDVGSVTKLSGEKLDQPYYFLESSGIGFEAQLHENFTKWEKGEKSALLKVIKTFSDYYGHKAKVIIDDKVVETRATIVNVANGPYSSAALPISPMAQLNDHRLTVSLYKMSVLELINYFLKVLRTGKRIGYQKIETYKARKVRIETKVERLVHADARLYGTTPVEFKIVPNALNVITGFPKLNESHSLIKRTELDP